MRRTLALAVLAAAVATPVAPASAYCMNVPVDGCVNPCYPAYAAYAAADRATKDRLPDHLFDCLA
jgi:hypothetical protein